VKEYGATGQIAPDTMALFRAQKTLDAIYVYRTETRDLDTVAKKDGVPALDFGRFIGQLNLKKLEVIHIDESTFLVSLPMQASPPANLALVVKFLPPADASGSMQYFLTEGNSVVRNFGAQYVANADATPLFERAKTDRENVSSATSRIRIGSQNYLTTAAATKFGNLRFFSLIDEKEALKALDELLNKSILYLIISILLTFIVSLILSHRLTFRMRKLTLVAEEIGKGDFDAPIDFESKDEVGVLAQAFKKMGQEIKQLFSQKIEKDRMERELQTAAIIQERLFPAESTKRFRDFLLSGYYVTSTECGGDWWHYYQTGHDLIFMIADTTGHGIPAALITSASNAIFSHIKRENYELDKIIQLWDEAVYQSSKGEFFMTAQFVRLHLPTGDGELINLGHELPILYRAESATAKFLVVPKNFSIGERSQSPAEVYKFSLDHGDQLLLYSDGVLAMMSDDPNEFSDKQFLKKISSFFAKDTYGEGTAEEIFAFLRGQSKRTLPGFEDDVTLVRISRGS
jgi:sigma-B regulation protein RsbU (phosphoserine phosphatase)